MMNRSGEALSGLRAPEPGALLENVLVLVDDFALPVGMFRIRATGSAGGHNGLESIERAVGTHHYARLRIGVGPLPEGVSDSAEFVLSPMPTDERDVIEDLMPMMGDAVETWMSEGVEKAMARFNRRVRAEE